MLNKHVKVCDVSGIALNDGVSIVPGYIEVRKDGVFQLFSDDPENRNLKVGTLNNRVEYIREKELKDYDVKKLLKNKKELFFIDRNTLDSFVQTKAQNEASEKK